MNHLALPMAPWPLIGTSHSDGGGLINFVDPPSTKA
jgi:hypothetical protein